MYIYIYICACLCRARWRRRTVRGPPLINFEESLGSVLIVSRMRLLAFDIWIFARWRHRKLETVNIGTRFMHSNVSSLWKILYLLTIIRWEIIYLRWRNHASPFPSSHIRSPLSLTGPLKWTNFLGFLSHKGVYSPREDLRYYSLFRERKKERMEEEE